MELAWLGWLHLEVDITNSILKPTKCQVQPLGCLIRLPTTSCQTDTEAKGCGPLQQIMTNIYKFVTSAVTHYHNLTGMPGLNKSWKHKPAAICPPTNEPCWPSCVPGLVTIEYSRALLSWAVFLAICGPPWMPRLPGLAHQDSSEWPATALRVAQYEGHLCLLDFQFINPQYLYVFSDVFVIWTNPASNKS